MLYSMYTNTNPLSTANTEGIFLWGLVTAWFYFFFRPNHLRSIVMISSTMMPDATPANTDRRKEYADNMYTPFLLPDWVRQRCKLYHSGRDTTITSCSAVSIFSNFEFTNSSQISGTLDAKTCKGSLITMLLQFLKKCVVIHVFSSYKWILFSILILRILVVG